MGGKLGVTPPVRIQQPATCISTNETLILERVTKRDSQPCCKHCDFFLTLNMIPCYGIHLTAFCSWSDFQTSLVEILYFPPMSMWWQLQLIISENLRNFWRRILKLQLTKSKRWSLLIRCTLNLAAPDHQEKVSWCTFPPCQDCHEEEQREERWAEVHSASAWSTVTNSTLLVVAME